MKFYTDHQLDIMMVLEGITGFIFIFLLCMKIDNKSRKSSLLQIPFFSMLLLLSDRLAYMYRGDVSTSGYWMVRISNFSVYASILMVQNGFNNYLFSLSRDRGTDKRKETVLVISRYLAVTGLFMLIVSQFTGLYYTFDDTNHYVRAPGFVICYIIPMIMIVFQSVFIVKNRGDFEKSLLISLFVFAGFPVVTGVLQIFFYGASFTSVSIAISSVMLYISALFDLNSRLVGAAKKEMSSAVEMKEKYNDLLQQTVEALVSAVDAKDTYTHGHSNRVAKYARKIAEVSGMTEQECEDVYLAGLLHDVGKIGIDDAIINKKGKLTDEEFSVIKHHPDLGSQILSKILISPSLSVGAHYHHEKYDGTGYPEKLKGEDIPQIARIIAVADAYDAMTSKRSYRDMIPQMYVREELVKGMGTQFDPGYVRIMIDMLDRDEAYDMREKQNDMVFGSDLSYSFEAYKTNVSAGVRITDCPVTIKIQYTPSKDGGQPVLLFYDSADERYYLEDSTLSGEMDFIEFASIDMDGSIYPDYVRKNEHHSSGRENERTESGRLYTATIIMVKQEDHFSVKITSEGRNDEVIFAMYDASRFLYFAMTGEYCVLNIQGVDVADKPVAENFIPRIAEKVSYTDRPEGDIPNVQIDGWMTSCSEVSELNEKADISFHFMSLPSSRRVWHCPVIALFTSADGTVNGPDYRELAFIRLDGEVWCNNTEIINKIKVTRSDDFTNWSTWKQKNKAGTDCRLLIKYTDNVIDLQVENSGLIIENQTVLPEEVTKVYYYFTGDQCAVTEIFINKHD